MWTCRNVSSIPQIPLKIGPKSTSSLPPQLSRAIALMNLQKWQKHLEPSKNGVQNEFPQWLLRAIAHVTVQFAPRFTEPLNEHSAPMFARHTVSSPHLKASSKTFISDIQAKMGCLALFLDIFYVTNHTGCQTRKCSHRVKTLLVNIKQTMCFEWANWMANIYAVSGQNKQDKSLKVCNIDF